MGTLSLPSLPVPFDVRTTIYLTSHVQLLAQYLADKSRSALLGWSEGCLRNLGLVVTQLISSWEFLSLCRLKSEGGKMLNLLPSVIHSFIQSVFILSVSYMQLVSWATEDPGAAALGWVLGPLVHLPRA